MYMNVIIIAFNENFEVSAFGKMKARILSDHGKDSA